jgi:hypothetical protein
VPSRQPRAVRRKSCSSTTAVSRRTIRAIRQMDGMLSASAGSRIDSPGCDRVYAGGSTSSDTAKTSTSRVAITYGGMAATNAVT